MFLRFARGRGRCSNQSYLKIKIWNRTQARGQGFEPRLPGPEPGVLPLDDPRIALVLNTLAFLI